jgi:hypothetical protein
MFFGYLWLLGGYVRILVQEPMCNPNVVFGMGVYEE